MSARILTFSQAAARVGVRVKTLQRLNRLGRLPAGRESVLGCRVSERRGRWYSSFQFDTDWVDGEQSDKSEAMPCAKARKIAAAQADVDDDTPPVKRVRVD